MSKNEIELSTKQGSSFLSRLLSKKSSSKSGDIVATGSAESFLANIKQNSKDKVLAREPIGKTAKVAFRCSEQGKKFVVEFRQKISGEKYTIEKISKIWEAQPFFPSLDNASSIAGVESSEKTDEPIPINLLDLSDWHCPYCGHDGTENEHIFIKCGECSLFVCGGRTQLFDDGRVKFLCYDTCGRESILGDSLIKNVHTDQKSESSRPQNDIKKLEG